MTNIDLNARGWVTAADFYTALLAGLGAPPWHGTSANALIDSMIHGGINDVVPPFRVTVHGAHGAGEDARDALLEAVRALREAGANCFIADNGTATIEVIEAVY